MVNYKLNEAWAKRLKCFEKIEEFVNQTAPIEAQISELESTIEVLRGRARAFGCLSQSPRTVNQEMLMLNLQEMSARLEIKKNDCSILHYKASIAVWSVDLEWCRKVESELGNVTIQWVGRHHCVLGSGHEFKKKGG